MNAIRYAKAASGKHVIALLKRARVDLDTRLKKAEGLSGPGKDTFTSVQLRVAKEELKRIMIPLQRGLSDLIADKSKFVTEAAVQGSLKYMSDMEKKFTGIGAAAAPRLHEAMILDKVVSGTEASVLRRLGTSGEPQSSMKVPHKGKQGILDRYGLTVVDKFEQSLQLRFAAQKPWNEVRAEVIKESPFLSAKGKPAAQMWAERIVRTEVMAANNRANWQTIAEANEVLGDAVKILAATFDNRTAADSYAVHGQIRRINEPFESWYGAYMSPPNRPNDREIVVAHRLSWPLPPELAWKSDAEIASAWMREGRTGGIPPRPKMTTIPVEEFGKKKAPPEKPPEPPETAPTTPEAYLPPKAPKSPVEPPPAAKKHKELSELAAAQKQAAKAAKAQAKAEAAAAKKAAADAKKLAKELKAAAKKVAALEKEAAKSAKASAAATKQAAKQAAAKLKADAAKAKAEAGAKLKADKAAAKIKATAEANAAKAAAAAKATKKTALDGFKEFEAAKAALESAQKAFENAKQDYYTYGTEAQKQAKLKAANAKYNAAVAKNAAQTTLMKLAAEEGTTFGALKIQAEAAKAASKAAVATAKSTSAAAMKKADKDVAKAATPTKADAHEAAMNKLAEYNVLKAETNAAYKIVMSLEDDVDGALSQAALKKANKALAKAKEAWKANDLKAAKTFSEAMTLAKAAGTTFSALQAKVVEKKLVENLAGKSKAAAAAKAAASAESTKLTKAQKAFDQYKALDEKYLKAVAAKEKAQKEAVLFGKTDAYNEAKKKSQAAFTKKGIAFGKAGDAAKAAGTTLAKLGDSHAATAAAKYEATKVKDTATEKAAAKKTMAPGGGVKAERLTETQLQKKMQSMDSVAMPKGNFIPEGGDSYGYRKSIDARLKKAKPAQRSGLKAFSYQHDFAMRELDRGISKEAVIESTMKFKGSSRREATEFVEKCAKHVKDVNAMFGNDALTVKDLTVYRGMGNLNAETTSRFSTKGSTITVLSMSSTSRSADVASGFAHHTPKPMPGKEPTHAIVFRMKVKRGIGFETISRFKSEREILIEGKARFRVIDVKKMPSGKLLVDLEEI